MPSIRQPLLRLSFRRAQIIAFWLLSTMILWMSVSLAAVATGQRAAWAWGALGAVAILLPGAFWSPWFETGIRVWNKGTRIAAAVIRQYVLLVSYYLLLATVGHFGFARQPTRLQSQTSAWTPWEEWASSLSEERLQMAPGMRWDEGIYACARRPGKRWILLLIPIVFLLILLGDEQQESAVPAGTYTLY